MKIDIDWSNAPKDATHHHAQTQSITEHWHKHGFFCNVGFEKDGWKVDAFTRPLSRYTSRVTTWPGEVLPPVGTVCEFATYHGGDPVWKECKIIAHDDGFAVIAYKGNYSGQSNNHLRPIRTPEQIAAEDREQAIAEMHRLIEDSGEHGVLNCLGVLYDARYRKFEIVDE